VTKKTEAYKDTTWNDKKKCWMEEKININPKQILYIVLQNINK